MSSSTGYSHRQRAMSWIFILLGVYFGVKVGEWFNFISHQIEEAGQTGLSVLLPYLVVIPVFFLGIVVHEAGHWLASQLVGFRCVGITIMWLHLERKRYRWHVRLGARAERYWGLVRVLPLNFENHRRRLSLIIAAGPVASILAGAFTLALGWHMYSSTLLTSQASIGAFATNQGLLIFGWYSLFLGVVSLIPYKSITDGGLLLGIMRNNSVWKRQLVLQRLISASYQGTRPRDYDTALLEQALAHPDNSATDCYAHLYAYAHALDSKDIESVRLHLNAALDLKHLTTKLFQRHLFCEAAYCSAVLMNEPDNAQHWLKRAEQMKPLTLKEGAFTRAAVAYSVQDNETAQRLIEQCYQELDDEPDAGARIQGFDRLKELHELIKLRTAIVAKTVA
ncbi:M50 family metallopeptidase [Hymenobacter sp. HDW8]|uniref:M50 family metallopeptidase n=1 Tax=Hymenobacter sp. HDW8 TaxID=2714932 RepID=UPI00140D63A9|nr:M50 family metallopeptidase [Hymenobacter sp. HDW8]QIL76093.1 M50 family metallopeptidase [Hymenobacter sp. HDW8]